MGLHQGIKANEKVPFFLAELRKRTFVSAYYGEISLATVLGRPPRLSYRYCTLDPPLDLNEAELIQTGAELAATLASLDDNGYNTLGIMRSNTSKHILDMQSAPYFFRHLQVVAILLCVRRRLTDHIIAVRTYVNYAMRREDIVDLALGQYSREEIIERGKVIEDKNRKHLASLPTFMQKLYTDPLELTNGSQFKPLQAMQIGAMRTGSRSNEILLQRVLVRKAGASSEKLTKAARGVFRDVLQITQRYDIASQFQATYNFYLSSHGLRSAAIVAIELLKQEMLQQYPETPILPRSQTIQDLAIFAARLAAVDPSDGCYNICEQGNRVISKILDRILSPQAARQDSGNVCNHEIPQAQETLGNGDEQQQGLLQGQMDFEAPITPLNPMVMALPSDMPGYGIPMMDVGIGIEAPMSLGQDTDFMRWLEGMNWERMDNWSM